MNLPAPRPLLTLALCAVVGCAQIDVTQEQSYRAISSTTERQNYGPWQGELTAAANAGQLSLQVSTSRQCDAVTHNVGERVTTARRENKTLGMTWLVGLLGVAGVSALAWGLDQHIDHDEPLSKPGADGKSEATGAGFAVYLGGVGSLGLITLTDAAIRSVDTETSEPVKEAKNVRQVCEELPLAGARVQVWAGDQLLAESRTDRDGKAAFRCLPEQLELLGEPPQVRINGTPAPQQPLGSRYAFATDTATTELKRLELFRRALAHAPREDVVQAALRAGGKQLEESDHVWSFDVTSLGWPHSTTLKLLFDDHGVFVKARWLGDYSGSRQTDVLKALSERYGAPNPLKRSDGTLMLRWVFADGLEIQYSRLPSQGPSACPVADLSYVDPVAYAAFESSVNKGSP